MHRINLVRKRMSDNEMILYLTQIGEMTTFRSDEVITAG